MAKNVIVTVTDAWSELTDANVTSITVQNHSDNFLEIAATTGSAPASSAGYVRIPPQQMILNEALADLFPGATSAVRVFGRGFGRVFVSHA